MYNLIEYSDNQSKIFGNLWKYYRHGQNDDIVNSESFKFITKITLSTPSACNMVKLMYH